MTVSGHPIRLRGPWQYQVLADPEVPESATRTHRIQMPCHWADLDLSIVSPSSSGEPSRPDEADKPRSSGSASGSYSARIRFLRSFGQPRQLDPHERVWLVVVGLSGPAEIWLNDHSLGGTDSPCPNWEIEITQHLQPRNRLRVEMSTGDGLGPWQEVGLEIRSRAYLKGIRSRLDRTPTPDRLRISGQIAGESDGDLDLYVLLDGKTVAHQPVRGGQSFEIVTDAASLADVSRSAQLRVELVYGAVVWSRVEHRVAAAQEKT